MNLPVVVDDTGAEAPRPVRLVVVGVNSTSSYAHLQRPIFHHFICIRNDFLERNVLVEVASVISLRKLLNALSYERVAGQLCFRVTIARLS